MSRLCIDAELLTVAAAMGLQVSRQNGMPDNLQSETCVPKTMKTHRKINIFRLDLSAEDAARSKPVADVSFYLNKLTFFTIHLDITLGQ